MHGKPYILSDIMLFIITSKVLAFLILLPADEGTCLFVWPFQGSVRRRTPVDGRHTCEGLMASNRGRIVVQAGSNSTQMPLHLHLLLLQLHSHPTLQLLCIHTSVPCATRTPRVCMHCMQTLLCMRCVYYCSRLDCISVQVLTDISKQSLGVK